jgi:L-alanine-DL-glutamate epimerase-like enolase superfamily enzyme
MTHGMFENPPEIKDGEIHVPEGAGLGLRFDQAYLAKYEV